MKATLHDRAFGTLTWDEDTETYSGSVDLRPGQVVQVQIIVRAADSMSPHELAAFLSAARGQLLRLRADDAAFRARAAALFEKALRKASRPAVDAGALAAALALAGFEADNGGITRLLYAADALWPRKRVSFYIDGGDRLV